MAGRSPTKNPLMALTSSWLRPSVMRSASGHDWSCVLKSPPSCVTPRSRAARLPAVIFRSAAVNCFPACVMGMMLLLDGRPLAADAHHAGQLGVDDARDVRAGPVHENVGAH